MYRICVFTVYVHHVTITDILFADPDKETNCSNVHLSNQHITHLSTFSYTMCLAIPSKLKRSGVAKCSTGTLGSNCSYRLIMYNFNL